MTNGAIRFGLCCIFKEQPIKFRRITAKYLSKFSDEEQRNRLSDICLSNSRNLLKALAFCYQHKIGDFRINSQILPLKTHPQFGYDIVRLPKANQIIQNFLACGEYSREHNIRTTFHPDQFIVLSSLNPDVVKRSIADLEYQAKVSQWVNADVINIHAGGVYNDKPSALNRLRIAIDSLPDAVRKRLTLENDDKSYTPEDLLPVCRDMEVPLVYDVHHHRCLNDNLTIRQATYLSVDTWNREPLFHLSSPINGWYSPDIRKHHDFIDLNDFPRIWMSMKITVEVEAKAKEVGVLKLMEELSFKKK
ncbi:MAG: UV DNA damage repair endonuclease UvsE [Desulfobacula sp.]|jgi:UV DNA damage endonuclease|uniref:UV DNA damage repair endonuclease UvsE n=1 Tax=Desulfobacula sp. TaxID=2593537 RepID=UPI001D8ADA1E|nr:UV DNA damage repair endonuclease UvsE [Desulfobacula sp.]MBT3485959.1 UV DNA damage repair endonuclease UvsE [Desulfobacula sp.]MBT3805185.1 UV DNA damage repair endonuclease UvsE [Desulfobacula sp.]MBT4025510.1 UV DNA damage repair endonuclease UvsE [Desulfobacula sp.]MBT4198909.1 UV DNA damage repair endonuclease UvsE [Desulfobacula sp.]